MMYANRKGPGPPQSPSDSQAKEKLAVFVYEYLVHVGSKGAAEMFLKEINWTKNITLGPDPGFLTSWWNVFWDLYSAAPERREQCDHSTEAKAFHDYGFVNSGFPLVNGMHGPNATPSPLGMPPPQPTPDGMPPGAVPPGMAGPGGPHPGFFGPGGVPVRPSQTGPAGVSQASPHSAPLSGMAPGQPGFPPVVLARLPGQRPFRLPQEAGMPPFSGAGMFPPDPQQIRPGPGHMMGQRLPPSAGPHPRMPATPAINNFGMRPPHGAPMPRPWLPSTSAMHYSEPSSSVSTGPFPGAPIMSNGPVPGGPSTPIMPSPQNMAPGDGSIPERYNMMPGGGPGLPPSFSMGNDSSMGGTGGPPSEMMMNGDTMDIKNSPASSQGLNGGTPGPPPATGPSSVPPQPGQPGSSESMDYSSSVNPFPQENEQSEIAKIKQSMMEESKQFESKSSEDGGSNDFPFAGI